MAHTRASNNPQEETQGTVTVQIHSTNINDGACGHVSVVTENKSRTETTVTSFSPKGIASIFNIFSLPVSGVNGHHLQEDIEKANITLQRQLSQSEYKTITAAQRQFAKEVDDGKVLYSFAGTNLLSSAVTRFYEGGILANKTNETFRKRFGMDPTVGDPFGSVSVAKIENKSPAFKTMNCVSSAYSVLAPVMSDTGNSVKKPSASTTPSAFGNELWKSGFFQQKNDIPSNVNQSESAFERSCR